MSCSAAPSSRGSRATPSLVSSRWEPAFCRRAHTAAVGAARSVDPGGMWAMLTIPWSSVWHLHRCTAVTFLTGSPGTLLALAPLQATPRWTRQRR